MRALHVIAGLALATALTACSSGDGDGKAETPTSDQTSAVPASSEPPPEASAAVVSAESVAALIAVSVPRLELVAIDEDNDPNELLGRPNGYVAAVVLKDSRIADCGNDLGVDCGATIEEWPDADGAKARAKYIADLQKDSPMLGSEYHYIEGSVLVRVSGELKPSEAAEYEAALK